MTDIDKLLSKVFDPKNSSKLAEEGSEYLKQMLQEPGLTPEGSCCPCSCKVKGKEECGCGRIGPCLACGKES